MEVNPSVEKCLAFISCQLKPTDGPLAVRRPRERKLAVTLSRHTGSGAMVVAEQLATYLEARAGIGCCPWTVFDHNLIDKVLADHHLPKKLAQFMREDRVSLIEDIMEEVLGLHPPSSTLNAQIAETILKLAELGNVIIVGRGAHIITGKLEHVFHAHLVGSLEKRVERVIKYRKLDREAALKLIHQEDSGRVRYFHAQFQAELDDPLRYHLVINTDRFAEEEVTQLVGDAALRHADRLVQM